MKNWFRAFGGLALVALLVLSFSLAAQDSPKKGKEGADDKRPTAAKKSSVKVEKGPFKVEVTLKGIFEAKDTAELVLRPEAWSSFQVSNAVEQGKLVKKGETLVTLDMEKIDQAIKDLESERQLGELALRQAEEELHYMEKTTPKDLAAAERSKALADEDRKRFFEIDKAQSLKNSDFLMKNMMNYLENQLEELKQLEKMYKADDLTEETEEIILKRQRDAVEQARFRVDSAKIDRDRSLTVDLPRREHSVVENAERQALSLERSKATIPLGLNQKRLSVEKMKQDRIKSGERLANLKKDRGMMRLKAPADGIVYYGKCLRGQWTSAAMVAGKLQRGGNLSANEVFMTIVQDRPLFVRAAVDEKDLHLIREGMKGKVTAAAFPDLRLTAEVKEVSKIPLSPGSFEAVVAVDLGQDAAAVKPGMACGVKLVSYKNTAALTVPAAAVFSDETDEDKTYVYRVGADGKPEKRSVTVGKKAGTKSEILAGLKEGDEILTEKPDKK